MNCKKASVPGLQRHKRGIKTVGPGSWQLVCLGVPCQAALVRNKAALHKLVLLDAWKNIAMGTKCIWFSLTKHQCEVLGAIVYPQLLECIFFSPLLDIISEYGVRVFSISPGFLHVWYCYQGLQSTDFGCVPRFQ